MGLCMIWFHLHFLHHRYRICRWLLILYLIPLLIIWIGLGRYRCWLWLTPLTSLARTGRCFCLESPLDILIIVRKSINRILMSTFGEEVDNRSYDMC